MLDQKISKTLSNMTGIKKPDLDKILNHHQYKVPSEDRQDVLQDLSELLIQHRPNNPGLAYTICKRAVRDYWRAKVKKSQYHIVYASATVNNIGGITYADLLTDHIDYEARYCDNIDSNVLFNSLPKPIAKLVTKRLRGLGLTGAQRVQLHRFAKSTQYVTLS